MEGLIKQLTKEGVIDKSKAKDLQLEKKRTGKKEEDIILEKNIVPEDFLFKLKSKLLKISLKEIVPEEIPLETLKLIPESSALSYNMIPLSEKDDTVEIGMVYPEDTRSKEALRFIARQGKFDYKVYLISQKNFEELLKQYRTLKREAKTALEALEEEEIGVPPRREELPDMERVAKDAPIVKMTSVVLKHAVEGKASDIHIEPTREKLKIRFRLNGILYSSLFLPTRVHSAIVARIKILAKLKIDETRIPQDGRFSTEINGKKIDFRVSTFPTVLGEKVAIRVLDPTEGLKSYKELGLSERNIELVEKAAKDPFGLILATGPTGSGKTTTLYAIMRFLNKDKVNIVTLEDPVEYSIKGVNQSQVKPEINYTFARGLRHILRQDPDIIMVGEIRDEETAALAIHAALTGHLVLSTLHTNNATGVIPRLIDMGIKPFLLSPTLNIAISQRLIRALCPYCKKKVKADKKIKKYILEQIEKLPSKAKKEIDTSKTIYVYRAEGCDKCNFKGYTGRTGIFEVLEMTDQLSGAISEKISPEQIRKKALEHGMITMAQDGVLKALKGVTTVEEVMKSTQIR